MNTGLRDVNGNLVGEDLWQHRRLLLPLLVATLAAGASLVGMLSTQPRLDVMPLLLLMAGGAVLVLRNPVVGVLAWLVIGPLVEVRGGSYVLNIVYDGVHRVLLVGLVLFLILGAVARRSSLRLNLPEVFSGLYIIYTVCSVLVVSDQLKGDLITAYDRVVLPLATFFVARRLVDRPSRMWGVVMTLLLAVIFQDIIALFSQSAATRAPLPEIWFRRSDRVTGSMGNPVAFGATMLMMVVILNHARHFIAQAWLRRTILIASGVVAVVAALTYSRSVWIAVGLILILSLWMHRRTARTIVPLVTLTIVLLASGLLASQAEYAQQRLSNEQTFYGRLAKLYASIDMFEVKPVFGWGYRQMDSHFDQYLRAIPGLVDFVPQGGSHNSFLTVLVEMGIIGFVLYHAPILIVLRRSVKASRRMPQQGFWSRELMAMLWIAVAVHLWVSNTMDMRFFGYALAFQWFVLGMLAGITDWVHATTGTAQARMTTVVRERVPHA